jgi:uncharacterized membrane protein
VAPVSRRQHRRRRNLIAAVVGTATAAAAFAARAPWPVAVTGGWSAAVVVVEAMIWPRILPMGPEQTQANAREEDFSRATADLVLLGASLASLVAIFYLVAEAGHRHGTARLLLALLAVTALVLSWLIVQTIYTVRYGDLYYDDPIGGIDFNEDADPDYHDFLYLAFTIGMTFQVSDTNLGNKAMRRTAIRQAQLSFVFVAVLLAVTINVVA